MIKEIEAITLKDQLDKGIESIFLLDVREPYEYNQYNIGGTLIPLNELPNRLDEIPTEKEIVIICRSGVRSMTAANYLNKYNPNMKLNNLKGGVLAWSKVFDK